MGAKSRLFLILVASLIGIGFALVPATEAESSHKILSIEHNNANIENSMQVLIENNAAKEIPYSLTIEIFSEDLQENIELESSSKLFSIDELGTHTTNISFTIPISGSYVFNLTLLSNDNGTLEKSSIEYKSLFYDSRISNLESKLLDYYLDENDNANWIFNDEQETINLINIEDQYNTGVVIGPYYTNKTTNNQIIIETDFEKSDNAEYTILYTSNFNSSQLYSTIWTEIYVLNNDENLIVLDLLNSGDTYLKFEAKDNEPLGTGSWSIDKITHKYITVKHDLVSYAEEHQFFEIGTNPEITISIENTGIFDQQLGNVTINLNLFSKLENIGTYARTPNILSEEMQEINFVFPTLEAGNYFCTIDINIINDEIYAESLTTFISISNTNIIASNLSYDSFERVNIIIESESDLDYSNYSYTNLIGNYYLLESIDQEFDLNSIEYRIISAISMDENIFDIKAKETVVDTSEGIMAPHIEFQKNQNYHANVIITNSGFYTEKYDLSYFYAPMFIDHLTGPDSITVEPGVSYEFEIEITPLSRIPREGGSQLRIEATNGIEIKSETYILSYSKTNIVIDELGCNRHSLLLGQDIICTNSVSNKGFDSNEFLINIVVIDASENIEIIDQIELDELRNEESLVLTTTYVPKTAINFKLVLEVSENGVILATHEMENTINVVAPNIEAQGKETNFEIPEIRLTQTVFALSIGGVVFQLRRSENFKYLTFKFFIPLYSRLQKDTLADEPTRQRLLTTIYTEPGANFTLLKEKLGLHNGTLAHHINILENNNMIISHRSGRQRLFFPFGGNMGSTVRNSLITNQTQKEIIKLVKDNPGVTQSMISKQLKVSRQKINYHVNCLANNSVLRVEKQGRITRLYPMHFT